jgi:hypothetical protein
MELAVQLPHVFSAISATPVLYLPREHNVQAIVPLVFLNLPGTHALQFVPLGPVYPRLHMQSMMVMTPGDEYPPVGHRVHVALLA